MQGDAKAASATQSSTAFDLNNAFEEWVRAGSKALSVEGEEIADEAAVLPASTPPSTVFQAWLVESSAHPLLLCLRTGNGRLSTTCLQSFQLKRSLSVTHEPAPSVGEGLKYSGVIGCETNMPLALTLVSYASDMAR